MNNAPDLYPNPKTDSSNPWVRLNLKEPLL